MEKEIKREAKKVNIFSKIGGFKNTHGLNSSFTNKKEIFFLYFSWFTKIQIKVLIKTIILNETHIYFLLCF